jgi:N-formylmaleamate deformylase
MKRRLNNLNARDYPARRRNMLPTLMSGNVTVNGIKIHYYRTGDRRSPVVLAHGITDSGLCWGRLGEVLAQDYEGVTFDARGHGLSEPNPPDFTIESHAADLAGLIEALALEQPVLIGHSMGASNIALAAAKYPHLMRGIILEDPPWFAEFPVKERELRLEPWRQENIEQKSKSLEEIIASGMAEHPRWAAEEWNAWAEAKLQVNPDVVEWMRSAIPFTGWQTFVSSITCPILLITGDLDREALVTPEIAQAMVGLAENVAVAHIDHVGHNIRRENFEEYVSAVGKFLRTLV